MCAIALRSDRTNLEFHRCVSLRDSASALGRTGKNLRHVTLVTTADVKKWSLKALLLEAIDLD